MENNIYPVQILEQQILWEGGVFANRFLDGEKLTFIWGEKSSGESADEAGTSLQAFTVDYIDQKFIPEIILFHTPKPEVHQTPSLLH